ncbi:hypothetical protein E2C01_099203 [Portunus trituberculatus]|uniref:Uncharacterized protein n=1 Tax=Portunus trituberculatus TaxID=210409 RepID=A0A5B7JZQ6_PORTR|nr:hypothetical protein [Portunus trituberculatus]
MPHNPISPSLTGGKTFIPPYPAHPFPQPSTDNIIRTRTAANPVTTAIPGQQSNIPASLPTRLTAPNKHSPSYYRLLIIMNEQSMICMTVHRSSLSFAFFLLPLSCPHLFSMAASPPQRCLGNCDGMPL